MDDLRFNVLFNSISVISGRWANDNERLCAMNPVYGREDFDSSTLSMHEVLFNSLIYSQTYAPDKLFIAKIKKGKLLRKYY